MASPESLRARPPLAGAYLPFAPLVYVAWADGRLTEAEIARVRETMRRLGGDAATLDAWLDPRNPPSPAELEDLLARIRAAGTGVGSGRTGSLAELGGELGRLAGDAPSAEVAAALGEVEEALGVVGREMTRILLPRDPETPVPPVVAPPFAVAALTTLLDGPRRAVRERVREILRRPEMRLPLELDRAAHRAWVRERCHLLAAEGIGALAYPVEHGGGGDLGDFVVAFETLACHDPSLVVKLGVQFGLFGGSVQMLGSEAHQRRYLPRIATLELPGCFAMSETGHGSNVRDLETTATYDPTDDTLIVHTPHLAAQKDWIGNAARDGRLATVFAQLEVGGHRHGVHAVLVPIRDEAGEVLPGVTIEDCGLKEGLNGVDNGRIVFDRVRVPRANLLDRHGRITDAGEYESPIPGESRRFFTMLGTLVGGRVSVAGAALSAGKVGLAIAVRYGAARRQFGPAGEAEVPILDYRTHQLRLLPRVATAYALSFAQERLTALYLERDEASARRVEALAAALKSYASWWNVETLQVCRECCGGQGYLAVNRLGPLRADTDVYTTFEGDNVVLQQLVARSLLTEFRDQFADARFFNLVRHLSRQAARKVGETNPIVSHRTDESHLRSRELQVGALRYREERLLNAVAGRLRSRIQGGMDSFAATIEVQDHLLAVANAHVERLIAECFADVVDAQPEGPEREVLAALRDLYALSRIHHDRGWFLAHDVLAAAKSRAIRDLVARLCAELRPHAVALVDAFAIPDVCLAPIAFQLGDRPSPFDA